MIIFSACFDRHKLESRKKRCFLLRILVRTAGRLRSAADVVRASTGATLLEPQLPHPVTHSSKIALPCRRLKSLSGGALPYQIIESGCSNCHKYALSLPRCHSCPVATPRDSLAGRESRRCQREPRLHFSVGGSNHRLAVLELQKLWLQRR